MNLGNYYTVWLCSLFLVLSVLNTNQNRGKFFLLNLVITVLSLSISNYLKNTQDQSGEHDQLHEHA